MIRQSNGTIVVANGGTGELRAFDSLGRFLRSSGRTGSGPGEFRQLFGLFLGPKDSIIAYDVVQGFHIFDSQGRYQRTVTYGRGTSTPLHLWPYGWLAGGYQLAGGLPTRNRFAAGRSIDSMVFYRVNPSGDELKELLHYPAFDMAAVGGGPRIPVVFAPGITVAVWSNRFCVGFATSYEVRCQDLSRPASMVIRLALPPKAISNAAIQRYKELVRNEQFQGSAIVPQPIRARREEQLRITTFAKTEPAFAQIVPSSSGELWVRRYDIEIDAPIVDQLLERAMKPTLWDVFGENGKWTATVQLPPRFRVFQIGSNYVLGVHVDEDDVERVAMLNLTRRN